MPTIRMAPDTLNAEVVKFAQTPLAAPVFVNAVPKCGTHLLRNIMRMLVPADRVYDRAFIQYPILHDHLAAFDPARKLLSWGHLLYSDDAAMELQHVRTLVLVRDPYDWVLARARFFLSDEFEGNIDHVKGGKLSIDALLTLMIFGVYQKAPPMVDLFTHNAVAWLGAGAHLVRYEELVGALRAIETEDAERYFSALFAAAGICLPADWRARVRIGADRKFSGTARENLTLDVAIPEVLPDIHKELVDYAAPRLRKILGYA
jgi:hypothetical protein